jgi:hypothetical protein
MSPLQGQRCGTRRFQAPIHYADECAQAGRLWTAFARTSDDGWTIRSTAETAKIPCPADDAFVRYFASR